MPSEYTVVVRLEPFIQRFLKAQFKQENDSFFVFPPRHDFNRLLEYLLQPRPDYINQLENYGEETFRILLPNMEHKNPATYNYLSKRRQIIFKNKIDSYLKMLFDDELTKAIKSHHFTRNEAIDFLSEEFGFEPDDVDRLIKHYQRWIKTEQTRRFRNGKKKCKKNVS